VLNESECAGLSFIPVADAGPPD